MDEVLRQIRDGRDFSPPCSILRISAKTASRRLDGWPYSIAENVAHAVYWQDLWLARLTGEPSAALYGADWPTVRREERPTVRERFLKGLDDAVALAEAGADEVLLVRIAHHDAYHVGQWALLKRLLK